MISNYKRNSGLNAATTAPPVPPQRHSSIRASAPTTPPNPGNQMTAPHFGIAGTGAGTIATSASSNNASVSRLVIDLETKFGKRFHNVTEFPKPPPFLNTQKIYPSRTVKTANANINNNNSNSTTENNNTLLTSSSSSSSSVLATAATTTSMTKPAQPTKIMQPAFIPMKKNRAPPPPQTGVAAATVSVIRQSSFLYGSGGVGAQH